MLIYKNAVFDTYCSWLRQRKYWTIQDEKYYSDFCEMILLANRVQRNHKRISVRVQDFALDVYLDKTTLELINIS